MGWVVSVTPRPRFTPGERTPATHCTGGWVGPRAGLDTGVRGKFSSLCRGSNLDRPVVQSVARHIGWATQYLCPVSDKNTLYQCSVPQESNLMYSNDNDCLMEVSCQHDWQEWHLFTDSLKLCLKATLVGLENQSLPSTCCSYEGITQRASSYGTHPIR
jgi:hypothetical protein